MPEFAEPARAVPVVAQVDVVVCGGGPAGVAAAVAAARSGAKTVLLEMHGCLGGIWTAGAMSWIIDHHDKSGIMQEIWQRLAAVNARALNRAGEATNGCDVEKMKLVLEQMCLEADVDIRLHTSVVAAYCDKDGRMQYAATESKSGREAFSARVFIDCTGDGDLAAFAGCGFDMGHPETGNTQPMSLICLVGGVNADDIRDYFRDDDTVGWAAPKDALRMAMETGGYSPSYGKPSLFRIRDDLFMLMANHEYRVQATDARDITRATLHARQELHDLVDGLRAQEGAWRNAHIVATAEQIGVREGRRIHGHYTVTLDDMVEGRKHDDGVCRVNAGIDVHSTDPGATRGIEDSPCKTRPYDIPVRALIARDVDGLLMAGRCISGDFFAHASYRVTGNAVAMGEAAGRVAAGAALTGRLPQEIDWNEL